jgi:putative transposase
VTIDKSGANLAGLNAINADREVPRFANIILGGIELRHMIAKGQMKIEGGRHHSVVEQFYDLAK